MEPRRLWSFLFLFPFQAAEEASTLGRGATLAVSAPRHSFLPTDWLARGTPPRAAVLEQRVLALLVHVLRQGREAVCDLRGCRWGEAWKEPLWETGTCCPFAGGDQEERVEGLEERAVPRVCTELL